MRPRIHPPVLDTRPLLSRAPMLAASASALGVSVLAQDTRHSKFLRYETTVTPKKLTTSDLLDTFTPMQRSMYERVVYGLRNYSPEQLAGMSAREQQKIEATHKSYKHLLHRLRIQSLPETKLIQALFPWAQLGQRYNDYTLEEMPLFKPRISAERIVGMLMENNLLPQDFLHLEPTSLFTV